MTAASWLQLVLYIVVLLLLAKPLGTFMARVYQGESDVPRSGVIGPLERLLYRLSRAYAPTRRWVGRPMPLP